MALENRIRGRNGKAITHFKSFNTCQIFIHFHNYVFQMSYDIKDKTAGFCGTFLWSFWLEIPDFATDLWDVCTEVAMFLFVIFFYLSTKSLKKQLTPYQNLTPPTFHFKNAAKGVVAWRTEGPAGRRGLSSVNTSVCYRGVAETRLILKCTVVGWLKPITAERIAMCNSSAV